MILYTDGGCSGNNQKDLSKREMVMVVTDDVGDVLSERREVGGSNNIAELAAVRDALAWAVSQRLRLVEIRLDSQNTITWLHSQKLGKKLNDRARVEALREDIDRLSRDVTYTLSWVPREQSKAGHYIERQYAL